MIKHIKALDFNSEKAVKELVKYHENVGNKITNTEFINDIIKQWTYTTDSYKTIITHQNEIISKQEKEIDSIHKILKEDTDIVLIRNSDIKYSFE